MGLDFNAFQMGQQGVGDPVNDVLQRQQGALSMQAQALQNQAARQQLQMQNIALQRQQTFGQDMQSFLQNPSATGVAALMGKYPEFQKQVQDTWSTLDTAQRRTDATQLGAITSLLAKGQYDNAARMLQTRIDAGKASGRDTSQDEQALAMLNSGDPAQQKAVLGLAMTEAYGAVGPDKAAEYFNGLGLGQAPQKLGPGEALVNPISGDKIASQNPLLQHVEVNNVDGSQTATTFNPETGAFGAAAVSGTPAEGGGPASGGGAAGTPRSVRNNNPGNLKATPFTKSQPGYQGVDDAGYAIFSSPQDGINAQASLLAGKGYYAGGRKTVAAIVSKWAPPKSAGGDNTNAQTANYIAYVSRQLGVRPGDVLTPQQLPQLAQAMAHFESGATGHAGPVRVPPATGSAAPAASGAPSSAPASVNGSSPYVFGGSSGGLNTKGADPGYAWNATHTAEVPVPGSPNDPNSYSPQEIDDLARNWIATGPAAFQSLGGSMGGGGIAQLKKAVLARATAMMSSSGIGADQLPAIRSKYKGLNTALTDNQKILSMLEASEGALHANAQQVLQTQQQLVKDNVIDNGMPTINRANLKLWGEVGSAKTKADIKAYLDAVNGLTQEYTKFMNAANGMGGNAAPSDAARGLAMDLNDPGQGPATMERHIKQIFIETGNKRNGVQAQNEAIQSQLSSLIGGAQAKSLNGPVQIRSVADYEKLPSGAHYVDPHGVARVKR
jgi:hypothetical protein